MKVLEGILIDRMGYKPKRSDDMLLVSLKAKIEGGSLVGWQSALNNKELLVCLQLSLKMNPNNEIGLSEKEMYEYCNYKSSRYFKRYLEGLVDKGILIKKEKKRYFFNPVYIEYDELGPKYHQRDFIDKEVMKEAIKRGALKLV